MTSWIVSVDLGQAADFTAISVSSKSPTKVVKLERPPLGTAYLDIAKRIGEICRSPALALGVDLLVDATGVGRPVLEMIKKEVQKVTMTGTVQVRVVPILITGGAHVTRDDKGFWHVPKTVLVSSLQVALQEKSLSVVRSLEMASILTKEMQSFQMNVKASGNTSFEALRVRDHDDLVLAVAQTAWWVARTRPNSMAFKCEMIKSSFST